ncbi:MAG: hypothetical protein KDJ75_03840 [Alphaproteobacteria bacterium]|nr:hypothetical protein [Alphaproteobacteria bacterium]
MNIDLLLTASGETGLICSDNLVKKASGVVFDSVSGALTLEFSDMDYMELNIPIESEFHAVFDMCPQIHIGAVKDGQIAQAYQIPFMFLDDPYRLEVFGTIPQPKNPLQAFGYFVKACVAGQPVHREDLGDEDAMGCVLGDAVPSQLQFAPHLARRHAMEVAPRMTPGNVPGLGLGGSGGGGVIRTQQQGRRGYQGGNSGSTGENES